MAIPPKESSLDFVEGGDKEQRQAKWSKVRCLLGLEKIQDRLLERRAEFWKVRSGNFWS